MKTPETTVQLAATALALGVGVLIGARACTPEPQVVERTVESPPKVVYRCPQPDAAGQPDAGDARVVAQPTTNEEKRAKPLPQAKQPSPTDQRRRLLAWARDQASGLIGCREHTATLGSVVVTFHIDEEGSIEDVDLGTPSSDAIAPGALDCVRTRMRKWKPPRDLVGGRRRIVFGLDL